MIILGLHSLWTNSWCSFEFNKAHNNKIERKPFSQSDFQSQLERFEQEKLQYDWTLECPLQEVDKLKDKNRKSGEILETKFIDSTKTGNSMDDMVFQYNNQNSIYVLNANYSSYEQQISHFGVIDSIEQQTTSNNNNKKDSKFQKIEKSARSLQQKLKLLEKEHINGITSDSLGNSITSLMSSATCSPATAVIQKLINCNNNVENTFHANVNANSISLKDKAKDYTEAFEAVSINSNRNANRNCSPRSNSKLSTVMIGNRNSGSSSSNSSSSNINSSNGKKKFNSIKPTLIAKKTKFWKFLEEEKARLQDEQDASVGNSTTTNNCEQCMSTPCQTYFRTSEQSSYNEGANHESHSHTIESPATASTKTNEPHHQQLQLQQQKQQKHIQRQQKVNNWSGNHDNNNHQLKQQQKSSYELYKEAAELLGLPCTLCDNCRCLDCQGGYFDCDDSDSYSDFSTMDDFEYGYEESLPVKSHEMALIMNASAEDKCMTNELSSFTNSLEYSEQTSPSRTNLDRMSQNYNIENEEATNMGDCCCQNGNCRMEPHTNELDHTDDSNFGFNKMNFQVESSNVELSSMDSLLTVVQPTSSGALINTMNSGTQQKYQKILNHHEHHQKHSFDGNDVENCVSFKSLNLLDKRVTDDSIPSDRESQINCKN